MNDVTTRWRRGLRLVLVAMLLQIPSALAEAWTGFPAQRRLLDRLDTDHARAIFRADDITPPDLGDSTPQFDDLEQEMETWAATLEHLRGSLESSDGYLATSDDEVFLLLFNRTEGKSAIQRKYSRELAAVNGTLPDNTFARLDTKIDALLEEMNRLAPRYSLPAGETCATKLRGVLERKIKAGVPDAEIVNAVLLTDGWTVKRSSLGIPNARTRRGAVLYSVPGQQWLICRQFVTKQPYFGGEASEVYEVKLGYIRCQLHE